MDKNDKKDEEEKENSWGDSDEYADKIKSKYRNKSGSGKITNKYYDEKYYK